MSCCACCSARGYAEREGDLVCGVWWRAGAKELDSMMEGMQSEDEQRKAFSDADINKGLLRHHPLARAQ